MHKNRIILIVLLTLTLSGLFGFAFHNRHRIYRYFSRHIIQSDKEFDAFFAQWKVYGLDVSEYQGDIDWKKVDKIFGKHQIHFVFIRATAGIDKVDDKFLDNWNAKKKEGVFQGAYHYYRPDENAIAQANNFITQVDLKKGNLPPVLDIEQISSVQSLKKLKIGLKKWLQKIEKHYGVKPIIYTGSTYFTNYLKKEFKDYTLWVANYNRTKVPVRHNWKIWQYSSNGNVEGINAKVDINVFDGSLIDCQKCLIK